MNILDSLISILREVFKQLLRQFCVLQFCVVEALTSLSSLRKSQKAFLVFLTTANY